MGEAQIKDLFLEEDTLANAKQQLNDKLNAGEVVECPCCEKMAKQYRRKLHATQAAQLIRLLTLGGDFQYIHTSKLIENGRSSSSDFTMLRHWGLIRSAKVAEFDTARKSSGRWILTEMGIRFAKNLESIPEAVIVYNDEVIRFSEEKTNIHTALSDQFDYVELLNS